MRKIRDQYQFSTQRCECNENVFCFFNTCKNLSHLTQGNAVGANQLLQKVKIAINLPVENGRHLLLLKEEKGTAKGVGVGVGVRWGLSC